MYEFQGFTGTSDAAGGTEGLRPGKGPYQGVGMRCQDYKEMISAQKDLLCILASTLLKEKLLGLARRIAVRS